MDKVLTHYGVYGKENTDPFKNDDYTIILLASPTCYHCQEYKPIINKLANSNDFNLYFFEIDKLSSEDSKTLTTTFDISDFDGSVPYTFIINNNEVVGSKTGYSTRDAVVNFLTEYEIIEN